MGEGNGPVSSRLPPLDSRIKVLHLITKLEFGGAQQNTLYTVEHLNPGRFEACLASGAGGYLDDRARTLASQRNVQWLKWLRREIHAGYDAMAFIELYRLFKRVRPDIVHTHSSKAGIIGRWAARHAGVGVIVHTYHGFGFHDRQRPAARGLYATLEKLTAGITDHLIYVSQNNRDYALGHGITAQGYSSSLIRSGVALADLDRLTEDHRIKARQQLDLKPDQIAVVSIGNLKAQKNPEHFIELSRRVAAFDPRCIFLFVGGWEGSGRREEVFRNAPPQCRYLGWREDAPMILKASDIFLMTSLWEGLPRSMVEAMRLRLPVAAYATDGIAEVVKDGVNGLLAPPNDLSALEQSLKKLVADGATRRALGAEAHESIGREFDIDEMVRQQERLYEELLRRAPSPQVIH